MEQDTNIIYQELNIIAKPLVSIIVITYNSGQYVLETLESAKTQTYQNIELIISDDASSDETVEICRRWLEENKGRFVRTEMITVPANTGIPANCNRGVKASQGEWVKLIAGDDILLPDCLYDNLKFASSNKNKQIFLSRVMVLRNGVTYKSEIPIGIKINFKAKEAHEQYKALLKRYFGSSPSLFISKNIFKTITYDENFRFIEDYPFALNVTKSGFSFAFMDKETVKYRIHEHSISNKERNKLFGDFYLKRHEFDKTYRFPYLPRNEVRKEIFEYQRLKLLDKLYLNRNVLFAQLIDRITYRLNPFLWFSGKEQ